MSKIGEILAWKLNKHFPTLAIHKQLGEGLNSVKTNQEWSYHEAQKVAFAFEPFWKDLKGKNILDIGTGLGGKQPFYFESGAQTLTGIDISFDNVQVTRELMNQRGLDGVTHLAACDASAMPFVDNIFDGIVSINVFEHIMKVNEALQEAYRVLKPNGLAFIHLPPYYSPWGPHLEHWIHIPWAHLVFSDKTLMRVSARVDARTQVNSRFVKEAQMDWQKANDHVPNVNKVTFQQFHHMIQQAGFTILQLILLPIGYERVRNAASPIEKFFWHAIGKGRYLPILREAIITKMIYVLTKESNR